MRQGAHCHRRKATGSELERLRALAGGGARNTCRAEPEQLADTSSKAGSGRAFKLWADFELLLKEGAKAAAFLVRARGEGGPATVRHLSDTRFDGLHCQ